VRPALERAGTLTLHVAPGLADTVAARLGDKRILVREDASVPPSDARATWPDGEALACFEEVRGAMAAMLASFGLAAPEAADTGRGGA
jgi:hypothetical protein